MSELTCDENIYKNGTCVGIMIGHSKAEIEDFVKSIADETQQPVDWHYAGGRARILTTGDTRVVRHALSCNNQFTILLS